MQEKQVTIGGVRHPLEPPFFVLATQNPIEQEGTYTLPEAQQDRFMFKILVDYPSAQEEIDIVKNTTSGTPEKVNAVISGDEVVAMQAAVRGVPVSDDVIRYATKLVRATRVSAEEADAGLKEWVTWGAGPRASQYLILGAKTRAAMAGRVNVTPEDVQKVALPVLRHRIVLNFAAESEGMTADKVLTDLLKNNPPHQTAVTDKVESF
jgi:MoxR-like ATPase